MHAARDGRADLVQVLLKAGARTSRTDYSGRTALEWAREGRSTRVVTLLEQASR
jgi:ankyrin repeat protein